MTIAELRGHRAKKIDALSAMANLDKLTAEQETEFKSLEVEIETLAGDISRKEKAQALSAEAARPVAAAVKTFASAETDPYVKDQSLIMGGIVRLAAMSKGNIEAAARMGNEFYGEGHPVAKAIQVSKALNTGVGSSGGFVVPPDFASKFIDLLYARTVIRKAGARTMPMPNGTMTVPKLTGGSTAQWVGEGAAPSVSQPRYGQVVATARKLMALVPISNDMLRYAMPGFDAKVRDDLLMQVQLAEDSAFIRSAGTSFTPRGLKSFALAASTVASNATFTFTTVGTELASLINKLEEANLPMAKPTWLMRPRTKNYLMNLQSTIGTYIYRDEMMRGTLLAWPFFVTTQIPNNLTVGPNSDCSEIYAVDMNECVIYESRQFELAISQDATYLDENSVQQNAFAQDMSLVRCLTAEDFQMDHDEGVAVLTGVRWA